MRLLALAERVAAGEPVSDEEALDVLGTPNLIEVAALGDELRRRLHGAQTTFAKVFEVHVSAPPSSLPPALTAGELRLVGPPADFAAAVGATRQLAALGADGPLTGFSLADLETLAGSAEGLRGLCEALADAGLVAIAEAPLDVLERAEASIDAARAGGLKVLRLTVHARQQNPIQTVVRARDLQRAVGGLNAFAPLPRQMSATEPTTGYDDIKQVALARMIAFNIPHIQVDWPLYGPKLAQVALTAGADDVDGVAAIDSGALGTRRSPLEEIRKNIEAAGLIPLERDGLFALLKPGSHALRDRTQSR